MPRILVLLAAVCFGTTGTAQALGPEAAPLTVGATRIAIGGLLLLLVARAVPAAAAPWPRRELGVIAVAIAIYQLAFFAAVDRTGVAVGTVVALGSAPALAGRRRAAARRRAADAPLGARDGARLRAACCCSCSAAAALPSTRSGSCSPWCPARATRPTRSSPSACCARGHAPERVMAASFSLGALLLAPVLIAGDLAWLRSGDGLAHGALPRRDPDGARVRAVRARAPPPDARRDRDAHARRAADRNGPRDPRAGRAARGRSPPPAPCSSSPACSRSPLPARARAPRELATRAGMTARLALAARLDGRRDRRGAAHPHPRRRPRRRRAAARARARRRLRRRPPLAAGGAADARRRGARRDRAEPRRERRPPGRGGARPAVRVAHRAGGRGRAARARAPRRRGCRRRSTTRCA